jgi:hypothetical protein
MTPWGEPDIQATLDMMQASRVPLERCADSYSGRRLPTFLFGDAAGSGGGARARACDAGKAWLTQAEYDERIEAWRNQGDASRRALADGDLGLSIRAGALDPNIPQRQTSLIVDPPDGLLPALTLEGKRRALTMRSGWSLPGENPTYDSPQDFDSWDRCITRGMPSSMMPYRYNGGFRIVQAPGYAVFQLEMIHEARVIPTDGREPLPAEIAQYLGASRGRWEGTTLVVETNHYVQGPPLINLAVVGSPPGNRFPYSSEMKTTERIVRLNDEWWLYEITTWDPVVLTRPFTVRYPMRNDAGYFMPEYACHENNTIVPNYVRTNRHERANPTSVPAEPVKVPRELADALAGRWLGRPRIATIDLDIDRAQEAIRGHARRYPDRHDARRDRTAAAQRPHRGARVALRPAELATLGLRRRAHRRRHDRRRLEQRAGRRTCNIQTPLAVNPRPYCVGAACARGCQAVGVVVGDVN